MGEQFCLRWNNHQSTVVSVVESFLNSDSLTDCTLAAEGKYLKAHKLILTACSPYFEALLCQQHHDKHPIFILKDVKFYELKAMLDYMYKGEVNISQDRLDSFIKTAESLQIKGLTDQGGGGGDCRDVGSTGKRKPGGGRPESPQAGAAPAREGSPLSKRRRRGPHCGGGGHSSLEEAPSTPAGPDAARLAVVPKSEPPDPSSSSSPPPPPLPPQQQQQPLALPLLPPAPPQQHPPPVKSELLLEDDETHHHIEDLTLDDDDDEDYGGGGGPPPDTSQPGTSFEGNSQASQDYSQWQMTGDRSTDEVFMAAQEAINSQSNSQEEGRAVTMYVCWCGRRFRHNYHINYHMRHECGRLFPCSLCGKVYRQKCILGQHMRQSHALGITPGEYLTCKKQNPRTFPVPEVRAVVHKRAQEKLPHEEGMRADVHLPLLREKIF